MKKIVVIGSTNTDMVIKCATLPVPGETVLGGSFFMTAGGKGANQAVAAARLGGDTVLVTKVGNDIFGQQAIAGFEAEKIDTRYVFIDATAPSGTALIMVNAAGENCIAVAPGANSMLLHGDIEKVADLALAEIILVQLEIPLATITSVVNEAKQRNQQLVLNPAPAMPLSDELLHGLFLITPNETEATMITGIKVTDEYSAVQAADALLGKGVQNVVITLGKKGAYFKNSQQEFFTSAPIVTAVDTTAAGDTFSGALTVALTEKMDWKKALQFAVEAASLSVTRLGAQASVPYREELNW